MWRFVLVACAACTGAAPGDDTHGVDASSSDATYHGTLAMSKTVQFGGTPYCTYSITLKSLQLDVESAAGGEITSAMMQNLNIEAIVGTCQYTPTPPTAAKYTLDTSKPITNGTELTFKGDSGNATGVALTIDLVPAATGFTANATFHRTDQVDLLDWTVMTSLPIAE
ncbi:MAG: hypothetical protein QM831_20475 [Kofleriaceae bacterium]